MTQAQRLRARFNPSGYLIQQAALSTIGWACLKNSWNADIAVRGAACQVIDVAFVALVCMICPAIATISGLQYSAFFLPGCARHADTELLLLWPLAGFRWWHAQRSMAASACCQLLCL